MSKNKELAYVITCGDEGVQINKGVRFGFLGAGLGLEGFDQAVQVLQKLFLVKFSIASHEESDWVKKLRKLDDWEQTNATYQQELEALADKHDLLYAGYLPFADPRQLKYGVKGHMVRPKKVHIASGVSFTLAGGEQTYHLGRFLVSAEWVHAVPSDLAKQMIQTQVKFYQSLVTPKLDFEFEMEGSLDEKLVAKNKQVLESILK